MNEISQEARRICHRRMVAQPVGLPAITRLCGTLPARSKAAARPDGATRTKRDQKRRSEHRAQADGYSWMDQQKQSVGGDPRASGRRADSQDSAGKSPGLQSVCADPLPIGLRPVEVRRQTGNLPDDGLHGRRRNSLSTTDREQSSALATGKKIKNGSPATGRYTCQSSRHGTKFIGTNAELGEIVPPRDEIPCFSGSYRPATGHLYRYAIYTGLSAPCFDCQTATKGI